MTALLVAGSPRGCSFTQVTGLEAGQAAAVPPHAPSALALRGNEFPQQPLSDAELRPVFFLCLVNLTLF